MAFKASLLVLAAVMLCTDVSARPIRQLQQQGTVVGYVPPGASCELKTSVTADKADSRSWFNSGLVITGRVTLLNPKEYGIPVSSVQVTAQSSDGQLYTAYADCGSGSPATYVPTNPVPYTYGQATCNYRIQLDNRVFGSATPSSSGSSSTGQSTRLGYFPDNNNNNNNNPGYYPSQPTWTVTAVTTIGMTNAQCYSSPTTVDTSSWWSWFINIIGSSGSGSSSGGFGSSSGGSTGGLDSAAPTGLGSSNPSQGGR